MNAKLFSKLIMFLLVLVTTMSGCILQTKSVQIAQSVKLSGSIKPEIVLQSVPVGAPVMCSLSWRIPCKNKVSVNSQVMEIEVNGKQVLDIVFNDECGSKGPKIVDISPHLKSGYNKVQVLCEAYDNEYMGFEIPRSVGVFTMTADGHTIVNRTYKTRRYFEAFDDTWTLEVNGMERKKGLSPASIHSFEIQPAPSQEFSTITDVKSAGSVDPGVKSTFDPNLDCGYSGGRNCGCNGKWSGFTCRNTDKICWCSKR